MSACVMTLLLAALTADGSVELISHRGESADAPENTLAAFKLAWERKVPAIELDVHLTKDGRLAVIHDPDTKRTTGVSKTVKTSNWNELRDLDAGRWKDPKYAGEKIPTLEQALATIPAGGRCFIEIKVGPEAVPAVARAVKECGHKPEQLVIISFNAATIAESKKQMPELKAYYLSSFKRNMTGRLTPTIDELITKAKELNADGLDLSHEGPLDEESVRRIREARLGFYVWTVDKPAAARRLVKLGVDGITTNKAAWLRDSLKP